MTQISFSSAVSSRLALLLQLLLVCTCAYVRSLWPSLIDRQKTGILGTFWKCARIGERLSPYVALACLGMAFHTLFISWSSFLLAFSSHVIFGLRWNIYVFTLKSLSSVRRIIAGSNPAGCWENECLVAPLLLLRLTLAYYPLFAFQSIQRFSFVARTHPQNLRQDTSGRLRGPKIVLFKLWIVTYHNLAAVSQSYWALYSQPRNWRWNRELRKRAKKLNINSFAILSPVFQAQNPRGT